jgi:hypothetical protein
LLGINGDVFAQQAAAKLYGRGWDGLTFAAELHKLVRMFRQFIPKVLKLLREAFRLYRSGALARLGYASVDAWLEGRYGWRILIYDIEDINELMKKIDEDEMLRSKERVGDVFTYTWDRSSTGTAGNVVNRDDVTNYTVRMRGSIIADFTPSKITLNPVLTAWEIVPFSFVVDWIVQVGRALEAMSFLALNNKYTACVGYKVEVERTVRFESFGTGIWSNEFHSTFPDIEVDDNWELLRRRPVRVPTKPLLNVDLNAFKVMDLVALVLQLFRK